MKLLRNLPLAARLGVAFGALGLGLLVVALTAIVSVGRMDAQADSLASDHLRSTELVGGIGERVEGVSHDVVEHLYVYDGDLEAQDERQASIEQAEQDTARDLGALARLAKATDAVSIDRVEALQRAEDALAAASSKELSTSRHETVAEAENRDGSRGQYLEIVTPAIAAVEREVATSTAAIAKQSGAAAEEASATGAAARKLILLAAVLAALVSAALAVWTTRSVTRPVRALADRLRSLNEVCLKNLSEGLRAVAQGDLTRRLTPETTPVEVEANDELGRLSATFNEMLGRAQDSIESYNAMTTGLSATIGEVSSSAGTVSAASQQMASTSEETTRAIEEIAGAVTEVAAGAERQVRMVDSARGSAEEAARAAGTSARTAQATAEAANDARGVAEQGVVAAQHATEAMQQVAASSSEISTTIGELSQRSERIGGIVGTITGLAEQTNLLALNAAIEAARAGEQGRGFAVVAEEVRKLAEESQGAAAEIATLIGEMQRETTKVVAVVAEGAKRTEDGVATVQQTREAFELIGASVEDMSARVVEIAASVEQISAESERMQADISEVAGVAESSSASAEQVSASTEQTTASAQEIASSAQELARTAETLERLVGQFRVAA
jgi:methyl-accepting chemotaxis protein